MTGILPWKECSRDWHPYATTRVWRSLTHLGWILPSPWDVGCPYQAKPAYRDWNPNIIVHWRWLMTEVDWWSSKISIFIRRVLQNLRGKFALGFMESSSLSNPSSLNRIIKKWKKFIQKWKKDLQGFDHDRSMLWTNISKKACIIKAHFWRGNIRFPNPRVDLLACEGWKLLHLFFPHLSLGTTPSNKKNRGLS